jgi:Alpha galactosidase A/Alpha galactosidase C-terminal beta sandwich domain/HYR domain
MKRWVVLVALVLAMPVSAARADSYNGLALTPPLGYNTWNAFHCNVSEDLIKQTALAMHTNGMQDAGYRYVVIDDCWMAGRTITGNAAAKAAAGRDAAGHLIADPQFFPSGIKALADYVHSLGLKLGIYEDAGTATCQGLAGSLNHEAVDAQDFADWGVDFLKYDWCNVPLSSVPGASVDDKARLLYTKMSQPLLATGKPIVFEAATLGDTRVSSWIWGPGVSNLWRTTGDISASFNSMVSIFTKNSALAQYAGPGHWNDADMLEVGTGAFSTLAAAANAGDTNVRVASTSSAAVGSALRIGTAAAGDMESGVIASVGTAGAGGTGITLTAPLKQAHASGTAIGKSGMSLTESRSHFGLWSMMAAPLIAGTDVVNIADQNVAILSDHDVLAVDQDPLGIQAAVVSNENSHWTLKKPLSGGDAAVALFNAGTPVWSGGTVPLDAGTTYLAKDLWTKAVTGIRGGAAVADIPAHATTLLRLTTTSPRITAPAGPITAQATEATGIPVSFDTSGTDAFGTALTPVCTTASGATFPIGPTHVTCTATDAAGRTASAAFEVDVAPPPHPLEVGGTVPATLSLTLGSAASFGAFTPGAGHDYTAQTTANVVSTAGNAALSVSDPGHLANGAFELPQPLRVDIAPASWTGPVSNAPVAITFRQAIGANDALRTGSYSKTLTFTLSTTAP